MATYYITTPIYYPSGEPHLGHVYTTLCADTLARWHRLIGEDVFFLTGTDEHGIKMVKTAAERGIEPRQLADEMAGVFEGLWKELEVSNDDFIRTPQPRHVKTVQAIVQKLLANDDLDLGSYQGWYDEGQEEFVTETEAKAHEYKSAISGRPLSRYQEPTWFFRLKKYAPRILDYIEQHPQFIQPDSRRNEVVSKLKAGVEDLSISRATLKWGIAMPNDPEHVVYVWIDALSNYLSALGYGGEDESRFQKYWPADLHLIGKEILWFHTVYWPAMLMGLGLPLPKQVFAHGWWTADGKKMSKSMGNFIDAGKLRQIIADYGQDALRYYLLRAAPFGSDLDFSEEDFQKAYAELANVLGNCLNRTLKMIHNYRGGALPALGEMDELDRSLHERITQFPQQLADAYARNALQEAAMLPVELARAVNGYIDATAPFKLAKDPEQAARLDTVLHLCAQGISRALLGLLPILPHKSAEGLAQLGLTPVTTDLAGRLTALLPTGTAFNPGQPLFPRVEQTK
jgi:methionyl-tRNA synthetase